jgi:Rrf2 family iron-sulfur cluster assembly transcriptional regulator
MRHHISLSYLEQVFAKLRQQGLVESTRGPGGGYTLGKKADSITVADIVLAIDDEPKEIATASAEQGTQLVQDMTQELWAALQSTLMTHMKTVTLGGLAREQRAKGYQVKERTPKRKGVFKQAKPEPVRSNVPNSVFALGQWVAQR